MCKREGVARQTSLKSSRSCGGLSFHGAGRGQTGEEWWACGKKMKQPRETKEKRGKNGDMWSARRRQTEERMRENTHTLPKSSRSCGELSFKRNEVEMEMERERGGMGKSEVARVTGQEHTRTSQEHQRQHEEAQRRGEATEHTCPRSRRIFAVSSSRAHASACVRLCVRVRV